MTPDIDLRPPKGRRHSIQTMRQAHDLHTAGWTPEQIVRILAREGVEVTGNTVRRWVIPGFADEYWSQERRASRKPWAWQRRMVELRVEVGLTCAAIARLLRHDFGVDVSEAWVREEVGGLRRGAA